MLSQKLEPFEKIKVVIAEANQDFCRVYYSFIKAAVFPIVKFTDVIN